MKNAEASYERTIEAASDMKNLSKGIVLFTLENSGILLWNKFNYYACPSTKNISTLPKFFIGILPREVQLNSFLTNL